MKQLSDDSEINVVNIHTVLQDYIVNETKSLDYSKIPNGEHDYSRPNPYIVSYDFGQPLRSCLFVLRKEHVFSDAINYEAKIEGSKASYSLDTLSIGTRYFCHFVARTLAGEVLVSEEQSFFTEDKVSANIRISGLTNCRDVGGWYTENGKKVNQRLAFRTCQYNKSHTNDLLITSSGINIMLNDLGINTEIDLREDKEANRITISPLGQEVQYYRFPIDGTKFNDIKSSTNMSQIKNVFEVLGDRNNYPVAYHCAIGRDRTGLITYLLNGYLGVSEFNLSKDYVFSSYANLGTQNQYSWISNDYVKMLKTYPGVNLSNKIANYLIDCGVSEDTLTNIKHIFLN